MFFPSRPLLLLLQTSSGNIINTAIDSKCGRSRSLSELKAIPRNPASLLSYRVVATFFRIWRRTDNLSIVGSGESVADDLASESISRFRSVQTIFSAHKKAHKTLDLECLSMTYGVVRAFQVIVNTFERSRFAADAFACMVSAVVVCTG